VNLTANFEHNILALTAQAQVHRLAQRRVFHRVVEQVGENEAGQCFIEPCLAIKSVGVKFDRTGVFGGGKDFPNSAPAQRGQIDERRLAFHVVLARSQGEIAAFKFRLIKFAGAERASVTS
jgi:hypothetical protein